MTHFQGFSHVAVIAFHSVQQTQSVVVRTVAEWRSRHANFGVAAWTRSWRGLAPLSACVVCMRSPWCACPRHCSLHFEGLPSLSFCGCCIPFANERSDWSVCVDEDVARRCCDWRLCRSRGVFEYSFLCVCYLGILYSAWILILCLSCIRCAAGAVDTSYVISSLSISNALQLQRSISDVESGCWICLGVLRHVIRSTFEPFAFPLFFPLPLPVLIVFAYLAMLSVEGPLSQHMCIPFGCEVNVAQEKVLFVFAAFA